MESLSRRALLTVGVAALAACSSSTSKSSATGRTPGVGPAGSVRTAITSVVMIGDSITQASATILEATLEGAGVDDARIEGRASRRIEVGNGKGTTPLSGVGTLYTLLGEGLDPSAWVIALGTNDIGSYKGEAEYGALVDLMTGMLPTGKPLVWVNTYRPGYIADTVLFNDVVAQRMEARGNAVVADWYSVASAPDQTVLLSDMLHPNENGKNALALLVLAALQKF